MGLKDGNGDVIGGTRDDARVARARGRRTVRLALPGMALTLVCLLPYLNKAYTIDDPLFLLSARQILKNPLQPMSYSVCWTGTGNLRPCGANGAADRSRSWDICWSPRSCRGGAEWTAHAMQILSSAAMAVLAMVRLALRLGCDRVAERRRGTLAGGDSTLSIHGQLSHAVLPARFGLTGFERLLAWKDGRHWRDAALAGLALGLALCPAPHGSADCPKRTVAVQRISSPEDARRIARGFISMGTDSYCNGNPRREL